MLALVGAELLTVKVKLDEANELNAGVALSVHSTFQIYSPLANDFESNEYLVPACQHCDH